MRKMLDTAAETERVRQLQDREAPRYDRQIAFFERILFAGGREWVCRQASGRVLQIAAGTARNSFDTIVCTLGLCTIPDPRRAIAEAHRVLRPGGQVLLLEHVRSPLLPVRLVERLLEPLAVRFAADHLTREPLDYLAAEGFEVEHLERSKLGIVERLSARKTPVAA